MPSTISAGTSAGTALNITSDTTGNLAFQTNNGVTALSIDTNQNVTFANNVTYTGTITATAGFSGNGAGLTAINASNVSSGTLASARLPTSGVNASTITAGTLAVAQGGTGASTLTANNVLLGNGTSALQAVAPGTNGNVLTSNGTTWTSAAPSGGVTSLNGQTGAITNTTLNAIGSYVNGRPQNATQYNRDSTIAGTSLYSQTPNVVWDNDNSEWRLPGVGGTGGASLVNTGTWRAMTQANNYSQYGNSYISPGLWVRIS